MRLSLFAIAFLFSFLGFSQFEEKKWSAEGSFSISNDFSSLSPSLARSIKSNQLVGIGTQVIFTDDDNDLLTLGAFYRYYFPIESDLPIFLYTQGNTAYVDDFGSSGNGLLIGASGGVAIELGKTLMLNLQGLGASAIFADENNRFSLSWNSLSGGFVIRF